MQALDGPSGAQQDFTDLHAWCEVYLPGAGWVGLDPTSGLFAGEGYIPLLRWNPTPAAPISGALEECEVAFEFDMHIARVAEPPRVTKPYSAGQWQAINALGDAVDAALKEGDVRLTMGGEPTFVSIDDMDGAEWTTAAVGPAKRALSDTLIRRLRARFAPHGLLHYGQGKCIRARVSRAGRFRCIGAATDVPCGAMRTALRANARTTNRPLTMLETLPSALRAGSTSIPTIRWRRSRIPGTISARNVRFQPMSIR